MASYPLIFVGDTHGFVDDFGKQKEIIEQVKPELVLYERLEDISLKSEAEYFKFLKEGKMSEMTSFGEVEKIVKFCHNKKIRLIGIDLKNFGFSKNLQDKIKKQEEISKVEEKEMERIMKKRDKKHIKIIKKSLGQTREPIVVIIGSWHLRDDSKLIKSFNSYKIIFPCDKKGNLLMEPSEEKEVFYREKTK